MSLRSYDVFETDIDDAMQDADDKLTEAIEDVWDKWDDINDWWKYATAASAALMYHKRDELSDALDDIVDEWEEKAGEIWDEVERLTGEADTLMSMSHRYGFASEVVGDERRALERIRSFVGRDWTGDAFTSFSDTIDEQLLAIDDVKVKFDDASLACAQGASEVNGTWTKAISAVTGHVSTTLETMSAATDVGHWVTVFTGPVFTWIAGTVDNVSDLVTGLKEYWDENSTVDVAMWNRLNRGDKGLDADNGWPTVAGFRGRDINNPDDWTQK